MSTSAGTAGVIGLGIMGSAIAANLQRAGFRVTGVDVDAKARDRLRDRLDGVAGSIAELPGHTHRLISSLPSTQALMDVCEALAGRALACGPGAPRCMLAETSTLPIADKQRARDRLAAAGIGMVDAPLSGTGSQALTRDLAVYASGEPADMAELAPVFDGFARARYEVGPFGNGMRMKLVANLLVAIHNVSSAEALLFAQHLGLDPARVVKVVGDGAGASRMLQVRGPMMAARTWQDATMKVDVWGKDMAIIGESLAELKLPAPLFAACVPIYQAALAQGHAMHDTAAVYAVLERMAQGTAGP
ncbi:MAG TPA: NAD(P)-dependent oxidoreductase [Burkholderiaceae bacterium]|nr:NAD(P)-dependent oxidoreductase [Burkholderiaceae bacterium]